MMERTDDRVLKLFKDKLNEDLLSADLDRTHRIGKKSDSSSKPRPVIVKFARYNIREKVCESKKQLKGENISITESLTRYRMSFKNVWAYDGQLFYYD